MADNEETPQLDELEDEEQAVEAETGVDPRIAEMESPLGARDLEAVYQIPVSSFSGIG